MARHHHHDDSLNESGDKRLLFSVVINAGLTVVQVIGGILSGSLSLIADALHNLGDAAALAIALFARKISRRPANRFKTFGYKRAELIAALINLIVLVVIGLYLIFEAVWRFFQPVSIEGWIVVLVAGAALLVDIITAFLTWRLARFSINVRAAFMHNISDALASVAVMLAGTLILLYQWYWIDSLLTLIIAGFVLYQGLTMLPRTIHILMEGTPPHISVEEIIAAIESVENVEGAHHVHVWQLDEYRNALEAHIVIMDTNLYHIEKIKQAIKERLEQDFNITHSTIEMETSQGRCES
ncbi:MAG: cation diffusion facilitator family transporter [Gammaproteobacteria bacterium]